MPKKRPNKCEAMDKNTIKSLFDAFSHDMDELSAEQLEADIADIVEELKYDRDPIDKKTAEVIKLLEREELPSRERLASVCEYLYPDHEELEAELAASEQVKNELLSLVDAYLTERGYSLRDKGNYQKRDKSAVTGLMIDVFSCFSDGRVCFNTSLLCRRARVRRGNIRTNSSVYNGKGFKRRTVSHPAESFDIFGDHGMIIDSPLWDSDLKQRIVFVPALIWDDSAESISYDLHAPDVMSCARVSDAEAAFEVLLPYLDGACSLLDRKKPNDEFIKAYRYRSGKAHDKQALLLPIFGGIFFGFFMGAAFFILDRLTGESSLTASFFVKMGLFCGAGFALLTGLVLLFERRRLYF